MSNFCQHRVLSLLLLLLVGVGRSLIWKNIFLFTEEYPFLLWFVGFSELPSKLPQEIRKFKFVRNLFNGPLKTEEFLPIPRKSRIYSGFPFCPSLISLYSSYNFNLLGFLWNILSSFLVIYYIREHLVALLSTGCSSTDVSLDGIIYIMCFVYYIIFRTCHMS